MFVSLRHLTVRRRQTILITLGIAVAVMVQVVILGMMGGWGGQLIEKTIGLTPDIVVKPERAENLASRQVVKDDRNTIFVFHGDKEAETAKIKNYAETSSLLKKLPDVDEVSPVIIGQGILRHSGKTEDLTVQGLDPLLENKVINYSKHMKMGKFEALKYVPFSVVVGRALYRKFGLHMGERIHVVSQGGRSLDLKIVGVYSTGLYQIDLHTLFVPLETAQYAFDLQSAVTHLNISVKERYAAEGAAKKIQDFTGHKTESWIEINAPLFSALKLNDQITYFVIFFTYLVASLGIANVLSMVVMEKKKDIGILKSMGATPSSIQNIFLGEGALLGIIGSLVGCGIGYTVSMYLKQMPVDMPGDFALIETTTFPMVIKTYNFFISSSIAIIVCLVSSIIPSRRASAFDPVEIIRGS